MECDVCGLAACDLPDEVDAEFIFTVNGGRTYCAGCEGLVGRAELYPHEPIE